MRLLFISNGTGIVVGNDCGLDGEGGDGKGESGDGDV